MLRFLNISQTMIDSTGLNSISGFSERTFVKKRSVLSGLKPGSAEYVVKHAAWRRSKGKGPTQPFGRELNPRKALVLAQRRIEMGADPN